MSSVLNSASGQDVVPVAGAVAAASLPHEQLEKAQAHLEVMKTLVADLLDTVDRGLGESGIEEALGQLTSAEGQALRAVRAILFEYGPLRPFGGMRRVLAPSGDLLLVCTDHDHYYDPDCCQYGTRTSADCTGAGQEDKRGEPAFRPGSVPRCF